ncbi:hypothetical protein B0G93_10462 [Bacillus sp. V-88]|nr:hypothetical protein B0G93_10462 [Bacillus sp. V-88]SLK18582.1 hypothetical protein SAMN06295884_10462 [Bacillus sp. V-88]
MQRDRPGAIFFDWMGSGSVPDPVHMWNRDLSGNGTKWYPAGFLLKTAGFLDFPAELSTKAAGFLFISAGFLLKSAGFPITKHYLSKVRPQLKALQRFTCRAFGVNGIFSSLLYNGVPVFLQPVFHPYASRWLCEELPGRFPVFLLLLWQFGSWHQ